jgi:hypothetical protein
MNTEMILSLIDKYFEGNTSLQEENQIRDFFLAGVSIPEEIAPLKEYFLSIDKFSNTLPSDNLEEKILARIDQEEKKRKLNRSFNIRMYITSGIAAAFILLIGFQQTIKPTGMKSTVEDPMLAMQIVTSAFAEVNKNMGKGMTNFQYLNQVSKATEPVSKIQMLNSSMEKAAKVHYFNKGYKAFQNMHEIPNSDK